VPLYIHTESMLFAFPLEGQILSIGLKYVLPLYFTKCLVPRRVVRDPLLGCTFWPAYFQPSGSLPQYYSLCIQKKSMTLSCAWSVLSSLGEHPCPSVCGVAHAQQIQTILQYAGERAVKSALWGSTVVDVIAKTVVV
jgi:hypothetical protein